MTFTEAAIEVLRKAGKPLQIKEIATEALGSGLLSHVGQTPEETMGARLLSMSKREHDRKVVALDPETFALAEWGIQPPPPPEPPAAPPEPVAVGPEPLYREKERHPPLQAEHLVGGRREDRRRRDEDDGHRRRKYPPPAEVAYQWLKERGQPATFAEIAAALRASDRIAEALERDLDSLERALREENKRRQDSRRPPAFEFGDGGTVKSLEMPREQPRDRHERHRQERPRREEPVRPLAQDEQRRAVIRSVRRRLGSLDNAALERVSVALLEAQGYREMNMARRSAKEGPLYLARHRWGAGELRYAIRVLRPARDLGRSEVQDVRRDLAHYSGQVAVVIGTGECARESKSEANLPNQPPVILYGGEALAEALVEAGLGTTKRLIEWLEYDEEFFASMGAGEMLPEVEGVPPPAVSDAAEAEGAGGDDDEERGGGRSRDRRRGRHRQRGPQREQGGAEGPTSVPPLETTSTASEMPTEASAPSGAPAETAATPSEAPPTELVAAPPPIAAETAPPLAAERAPVPAAAEEPAKPPPAADPAG